MPPSWILMIFLPLILIWQCGFAETIERYPLPTLAQQQQFQVLIKELRCLVCQNQDLADSNADLAKDLRQQVYTMILANKTDLEIKQYMIARYGDFILFNPPFNPETMALWLMPLILLTLGIFFYWRLARVRK